MATVVPTVGSTRAPIPAASEPRHLAARRAPLSRDRVVVIASVPVRPRAGAPRVRDVPRRSVVAGAVGFDRSARPARASTSRVASRRRDSATAFPTTTTAFPTTSPSLHRRAASTRAPSPPRAVPVVETLDAVLGMSPARDAGAAAGAAVAAYFWVKLFDVLASNDVLERTLSRKVIHTTSGPFFMLTWPLFSASPEARYYAAAVPAIQAIRLFAIGSGVIRNENAVRAVSREGGKAELLGGPFIYTLVLLAVTAVWWRNAPEGIAALSLMCGGDGLADIVGRRLGKGNALPWNADKSAAGSAAFFLGGFGFSMAYVALFHHLGYVDVGAADAAGRMAAVAAACCAVETLPAKGFLDDNVTVPALALALGSALFR